MKLTNKMQLCRIIYYSLAALHVSSDIFAHHQEHLNCNTEAVISSDAPDDERTYRSKHVEQPPNNKLSYTVAFCWSISYIILQTEIVQEQGAEEEFWPKRDKIRM
jgi:hypothetical protein